MTLYGAKNTPHDDAFIHPLIKNIEENNSFSSDHGVIAIIRRRVSCTTTTTPFDFKVTTHTNNI
jgi:hypothetical protein